MAITTQNTGLTEFKTMKENINFQQDRQIMNKERPKCANPKCDEYALLLVGDSWICGRCCIKMQRARSKMLFEEIQNLGGEND